MNQIFIFLGGLHNDFKNIKSQVLNSGEFMNIEKIYSKVEAEEQRKSMMIGTGTMGSHEMKNVKRSAVINKWTVNQTRPFRKCIYCKNGNTIDFCWDLHPEKKTNKNNVQWGKGRPHGEKFVADVENTSNNMSMMEERKKKVADQVKNLQAYLRSLQNEDKSDTSVVNQVIVVQSNTITLTDVV